MNISKYIYAFVLMFFLMFISQNVFGQTRELRTLYNLKDVQVLIENIDSSIDSLGITNQKIKTDVELKLRMAGLKVVNNSETLLYVNINALEANDRQIAYNLSVSLRKQVYSVEELIACNLLEAADMKVENCLKSFYSATWEMDMLGIVSKPNIQNIRQGIKDIVDEFLNDWLKANELPEIDMDILDEVLNEKSSSSKKNKSPFNAVYVGGNRPPEVEVFNDSDRTLYLDLGQGELVPYTIPSKTSKIFKLTDGMYKFKASAARVSSIEGQEDFKKGYKYTWRFTIVSYTVPR